MDVSPAVDLSPAAAVGASHDPSDAVTSHRSWVPHLVLRRLRGWVHRAEMPLVLIFVGFPLWWMLGLTQLAIFLSTLLMAYRLLRWRRPVAPAGFRLWMLFLVWVAFGAFVVQAEAPGAVVGANPNRQFTWALRMVWYLEATTVLLYIANFRRALNADRLARIFSIMFITITVGGLIGSLMPATKLTSLMELVLPPKLSGNAFVSSQVHPSLAERHVYMEQVSYRPSAPFTYANEWGLNYACFLPIFVYGWCRRAAGWRRFIAPVVLLASIVPVIYSLNRGLWAVIVLIAVIAALKQAATGHARPLIAMLGGGLALALVIALSPLGTALAGRFSGHNSNEGRTSLSANSIVAVAQSSPVVGMGTTRDVQGSFYSIAGGSTPSCPFCSPPAFGTQGWLWMLLFGHGLVGGFIGLMFFVVTLWRHRRVRAPAAVAYLCSLLAFLLTIAIYDWSETASFIVMGAVATLGGIASDAPDGLLRRPTSGRLQVLRQLAGPRIAIACLLVGALAGAGWQAYRGPTYIATASVWLPEVPGKTQLEAGAASTMDTEAGYVETPEVQRAVGAIHGFVHLGIRDRLTVTAAPNTRILNLTYASGDRERARRAATSAASEIILLRHERLRRQKVDESSELAGQIGGLTQALRTTDRQLSTLYAQPDTPARAIALAPLETQRSSLQHRRSQLQRQLDDLTTLPVSGGEIVKPAVVRTSPQRWNISIASGAALALLVAVLLSSLMRRRGYRLGNLTSGQLGRTFSDMPVLAIRDDAVNEVLGQLAFPTRTREFVAGGPQVGVQETVERLTSEVQDLGGAGVLCELDAHACGVIIVAHAKTRANEVLTTVARLRVAGLRPAGLVVWMPGDN